MFRGGGRSIGTCSTFFQPPRCGSVNVSKSVAEFQSMTVVCFFSLFNFFVLWRPSSAASSARENDESFLICGPGFFLCHAAGASRCSHQTHMQPRPQPDKFFSQITGPQNASVYRVTADQVDDIAAIFCLIRNLLFNGRDWLAKQISAMKQEMKSEIFFWVCGMLAGRV